MSSLNGGPLVRQICLMVICTGLAIAPMAAAETNDASKQSILDLPLEELMRVKVTTPARKPADVFDTSAAVHVIHGEDIRRSGATTIPEALRMSPGLEVARISPHEWAITSRGFNGQFANKLLVLVDGRSVYTPMNSGVNWLTVDTLLEDIDRIEVVRGPGGSLWGANAVNGVINIITKSAAETQGGHAEAGAGSLDRVFGEMRYGGKAGDAFYRVYGKFFDRDEFPTGNGDSDGNHWRMAQGGFRTDWHRNENASLTFQGDIYAGEKHLLVSQPQYTAPFSTVSRQHIDVAGGNLLGRWTQNYGTDSQLQVQSYYDHWISDASYFTEEISTFDFDVQNRWLLAERHDIVAGLGYRLIGTDVENGPNIIFSPEDRTLHLFSAFVQDEITLVPDTLSLTVGTKVEHHYFTGWNVQPNGRLLWRPHSRHSVWAAVSCAVRTPSVGEHDIRSNFLVVPGTPPMVFAADTTGGIDNEEVTAYELGYRVQPTDRWTVDLATFYNEYDNFQTFEPGTPYLEMTPSPPHIVFPFDAQNRAYGETYGGELASHFQATDWWRVTGSYTYLQIQLHERNSNEESAEAAEKESPHHQFLIGNSFALPRGFQFDWTTRYVDELPGLGVRSYVTMDLRLAWRFARNWELSLVGRNVLDSRHAEFATAGASLPERGSEVPREFYGKIRWAF
jgi:iron complex outermembrane receptor protein